MKKSVSVFIVFILIFQMLMPNAVLAENQIPNIVSNDLYRLKVPSWAKVLSTTETGDHSTVISDDNFNFTAKLSFEHISDSDMVDIREYLNDHSSNGIELFDRIIDLKANSYYAVEKSYENSALFYPLSKDYSEYNFKIIDKQIQTLFGVRAYCIMYNTLDATLDNISEFGKIDIFIPSYNNEGIFNINFIVSRDKMNMDTVMKFAELITSLRLAYHPVEKTIPLIFIANGNAERSAAGIYPAYTFKNYNMKPFYSKKMGLSFYYPDFLIPIDEITGFDGIKCASFKIDPYTNFNITVSDKNIYSVNDSVASALISNDYKNSKSQMNILESPNGDIVEIKYSYTENDINYKKSMYLLSSADSTITYTFISSAQNPSYSIDNIAVRILMTTKTFEKAQQNTVASVTYSDRQFGDMSLSIPDEYKIDVTDEKYTVITSPDVSTFKIYLSENELTKNLDFSGISRLTNGNFTDFNQYVKNNFVLPYSSIQNSNLGGCFGFNGDTSKIYRINKYLDENNRIHYCYSVSISKGIKLYNMLIDVNSMLYKEDGMVGDIMPGILNEIADSFKLTETAKS